MKKFVKLSLAAAVAVSGMSFANAASLEEVVKNTTVSGAMRIRVQDHGNTAAPAAGHDYTRQGYALDVSQKISDDVTVAWGLYATNNDVDGDNAVVGDVGASLGGLNVTYTGIKDTTAIIGRQALGTPFTVPADLTGEDHTGNGILVVNSSTPVTLIAGHMNSLNFDAGEELSVAAIAGKVGPVSLELWGAKSVVGGAIDLEVDHLFYKAAYATEIDGIKLALSAQNATAKTSAAGAQEQSFMRVDAKVAMGAFDAGINYGKVGKNGMFLTAFDATAKATTGGTEGLWTANIAGGNDESSYRVFANYTVDSAVKVGAWYINQSTATAGAQDGVETTGYAKWTMAKGTSLTGYIGSVETMNATDGSNTITRLQLDYKF